MESIKKWLDVYREEIATLENTSDEEAILKLVAEYEARIREDFAENKAKEIAHKRIVVANLEEIVARQEIIELEKEVAVLDEVDTVVDEEIAKSTVVEVEELPIMDNPFDIETL